MEKLNQCVHQAAEYTQRVCTVIDQDGYVIASSDDNRIHQDVQEARQMIAESEHFAIGTDACFARILNDRGVLFICSVEGTDEISQMGVQLLKGWIGELVREGGISLNQDLLLKNILLGNELPGDIPLKAREVNIPYPVQRVAMVVHLPEQPSAEVLREARDLLPNPRADYLVPLDQENLILLIEAHEDHRSQLQDLAVQVQAFFQERFSEGVSIGIGMLAETLGDCSNSYREASMALTVGNIFQHGETIVHYDKLGLGRLIYQLPETLCHMFLEEVIPASAYEQLDHETLVTIDKFFENNLNGSETARQLFVHRNTLVYRLDKVQKITHLDLRSFEDAVLFKLASMVRTYLDRQNQVLNSLTPRWWKSKE